MYIDELREYCLSKAETTESFPFDEKTLVFKVCGKMFLLVDIDTPNSVNLKCKPDYAIELREQYPEIVPGWHMSKTNWNTVSIKENLSVAFIKELIDHSYVEVVKGLKKADRERILAEISKKE